MARPRGDDVKRQVALATFELVAHQGVDGLSMRRLAELTGLSTGTINYHFKSKRGVLLASIEYGYHLRPQNWEKDDPATNLRALLQRYELSSPGRRIWWQFWLATASYAQHDDEVATFYSDQHAWVLDRFTVLLQDGVARGVFTLHYPPGDVARELVNRAHGQAVAQLVGRVEPAEAIEDFDRVLDDLGDSQPSRWAHTRG